MPTLSSDRLWETSCVLLLVHLLFHPPLAYPQSYAVALGGGLLLLMFKALPGESLEFLGKTWWGFLLYLLISSFWSIQPGTTLQSAGFVFLGTLLYLMARSRSAEGQKRLEIMGLLLAFVAAVLALNEWIFGFQDMTTQLPALSKIEFELVEKTIYYHRASGPLVTSGALAALMIYFIPLGITVTATTQGFKKWFFGFLTLILFLGLLSTKSVGAFAALGLAGLFIFWKRGSSRWFWAVLGILTVCIAGILWDRGLQHWGISALSGRLGLWRSGLGLFLQHPLMGWGPGTFGEAYQRAGYPLDSGGSKFSHNVFLQLLVETGLAGTGLFIAALADFARRFKIPSRWEGWGVGAGALAVFFFSMVDLPFQMPELVWVFALMAGRLELKPEKRMALPLLPESCAQWVLLVVLLISGFWPPFRPWNFALLACTLWTLMAYFRTQWEKVPLWVFGGGLYLAIRAFVSPSALGAVWFLEITGLLLVFSLVLRQWKNPKAFLWVFFSLGLLWALRVWWFSFQYTDVKDWSIFPNPKQVGIFLVPLVLLLWWPPFRFSKVLAALVGFATIIRLGAQSASAGLGVGYFYRLWLKRRLWAVLFALAVGGILLLFRLIDTSPTSKDRLFIWKDCFNVWRESPWFGAGPGAFSGLYHQVKTPRSYGVSRFLMDAQYAHNEYLDFLMAFGLVGLLFAGCFLWWRWKSIKDKDAKTGLAGLGAASFVDFCLHTPLIALQGAGFLSEGEGEKSKGLFSYVAGFLALGLSLSLFGAAVFSGILQRESQSLISQGRFPEALRCLEYAERLNVWDARYAAAKADYLENLYFSTKDPVWRQKSNEAFERVLDLEKADGQLRLRKAERLSARLAIDSTPEAQMKAERAWGEAEELLPFNAFLDFEKGLFLMKEGEKEKAFMEFETAEEKEPNYAAAWMNEGKLLKEKGERVQARAAFQKALEVYNQWKDADRIDPLEKQLVYLPPQALDYLRKEMAR